MADPKHTPARIKEAAAKVRAFHAIGLKSLRERPDRGKYADDEAGKEAKAARLNPGTMRAARRFADPVKGYSPAELDALVSAFEQFGYSLGTTAVVRLLSVHPKGQRAKFQKRALRQGWSNSRLEFEISKQFGTRRAGGRRRRVPSDKTDLLVQLEGLCVTWTRWQASLLTLPDGGGAAPEGALPRRLRERISEVSKGVKELHASVERALAKENPKRMTREDAQGPEASRR